MADPRDQFDEIAESLLIPADDYAVVAAALRSAVAEEREACAAVADEHAKQAAKYAGVASEFHRGCRERMSEGRAIARAIRGRGAKL